MFVVKLYNKVLFLPAFNTEIKSVQQEFISLWSFGQVDMSENGPEWKH